MDPYDRILGLMLIGVSFNTYLFGLVTSQFITYYNSGFKDPLWIRGVVAFMALIDTFQSVSLIYMVWWYCVTNYANPDGMLEAIWPYSFTVVANAITATLTQIFLGYRLHRLTQNKLLFGFICIVAVASLTLGMTIGIRYSSPNVSQHTLAFKSRLIVLEDLSTYWLGLQSGLDLLTTGTMVFRLHRSRTHFRQMNKVLVRLTIVAIQTGIFCTIFTLGDLFSFRMLPDSNLWGVFAFPIGRIYTNTLMSTLNMREELRDKLSEPRITNFGIATTQLDNGPSEDVDLPVLNISASTSETRSSPKPQNIVQMPSSLISASSEASERDIK